jgi:phosphate starvation-inducible protein PhoH
MTTRRKTTPVQEEQSAPKTFSKKDLINSVIKKKQKSKFLSDNQKEYYDMLIDNQITICSGPAGVGKS